MKNSPPTEQDIQGAIDVIESILESGMFDDWSATTKKLDAAKKTLREIKDAFEEGYKHTQEDL